MNKALILLSTIVGIMGVAICAMAGVERLLGAYHIMGFETMTLYFAGTGLMVFAVLVNVHLVRSHLLGK
jgi:hypothetical protein